MTIKRTINGAEMEIELTEQELWAVHWEMQDRCDRDDCRCYIEDMAGEQEADALMRDYDGDLEAVVDAMVDAFHDIIQYESDDVSRRSAIECAYERIAG